MLSLSIVNFRQTILSLFIEEKRYIRQKT